MDDLRRILPNVDFFLPNYDEASRLTGESDPEVQAAVFHEAGALTVIITMGAEGLLARAATDSAARRGAEASTSLTVQEPATRSQRD